MTNELTVRVEHPELPAIRWNEAEVQQNLTEMLAAYTGRIYTPDTLTNFWPPIQAVCTRLNPSRMPKPTVLPSTSGTSSWLLL